MSSNPRTKRPCPPSPSFLHFIYALHARHLLLVPTPAVVLARVKMANDSATVLTMIHVDTALMGPDVTPWTFLCSPCFTWGNPTPGVSDGGPDVPSRGVQHQKGASKEGRNQDEGSHWVNPSQQTRDATPHRPMCFTNRLLVNNPRIDTLFLVLCITSNKMRASKSTEGVCSVGRHPPYRSCVKCVNYGRRNEDSRVDYILLLRNCTFIG